MPNLGPESGPEIDFKTHEAMPNFLQHPGLGAMNTLEAHFTYLLACLRINVKAKLH